VSTASTWNRLANYSIEAHGGLSPAKDHPWASVTERGACSRLQMESTMRSFQLSAPSTQAIPRPPCPKCGTTMTLARIAPHGPGYERTFECPSCGQTEKEIIKFI
jgi:hypothetical protein